MEENNKSKRTLKVNLSSFNARQKVLIEVLFEQNTWVKRKGLLKDERMRKVYGVSGEKDIYFSRAGRLLTADIQHLNISDNFPYVIIQNSYQGIKIYDNQNGEMIYLENERKKLIKGLARYNAKVKKIKNSYLQQLELLPR